MNSLFNLRPLYCCHHHHSHKSHVFAVSQQSLVAFRRFLRTSRLEKYYSMLNCTSESTVKEIKESFLRLSKIYHPDNKYTGSHQKFVQLKEAYDAVKDGPSATSATTSAYDGNQYYRRAYGNDSYSNYNDWSEMKQSYNDPFRRGSFGGRYGQSSRPWEDMRRDREGARRQSEEDRFRAPRENRTLTNTLFLTGVAWIFIYSCFVFGMEGKLHGHNMTPEEFRRQTEARFKEYDDMRKRRLAYEEQERKRKPLASIQAQVKAAEENEKKPSSPPSPPPEPSQSSSFPLGASDTFNSSIEEHHTR